MEVMDAIRESINADNKLDELLAVTKRDYNMSEIADIVESLTELEMRLVLKKIVYGRWRDFSNV